MEFEIFIETQNVLDFVNAFSIADEEIEIRKVNVSYTSKGTRFTIYFANPKNLFRLGTYFGMFLYQSEKLNKSK